MKISWASGVYAALYRCSFSSRSARWPRTTWSSPRRNMIKSMTGFASATRETDTATIAVTIRAVNHRHLDLQLRVPQTLAEAEGRIRASVQRRIGRGRVELAVSVQIGMRRASEVEFNERSPSHCRRPRDRTETGASSGVLTPWDLLLLHRPGYRERPAERDAVMSPPAERTSGSRSRNSM